VLDVLTRCGFKTEIAFDHWLAKAHHGEKFIDVIYSSGNGIAEVDDEWFAHAVDETVPEGHGVGAVWISADGIPMKLTGSFTKPNEKVVNLRWELTHVTLGSQPGSLFEAPKGFTKLPAEAIAPLLGLKLKGAR